MKRNKSTNRIVGNKDGVVVLVNIQKTRFEILRQLLLSLVRLNFIHLLDLFLLGSPLNFISLESFLKLFQFLILQLFLGALSFIVINFLGNIFLSEAS